jgi:hypothetical protein
MPQDMSSIEDLLASTEDNESVRAKLHSKQKEIRIKELERNTKRAADGQGFSYINLYGFPISQDALVLIDEVRARRLSTVCFY